jgi:uncharacterized radical SAM superfamily Fe-S cluster-containing enzyme
MNYLTTESVLKHSQRSSTRSLPLATQSLCPICLAVLDATIYECEEQVYMEKFCPVHGFCNELISTDARFFSLTLERNLAKSRKVTNPLKGEQDSCPNGCGICRDHRSAPVMMNIDLTNRCNLNCPICFANANARGKLLELSIEQVSEMLDTACAVHEAKPICLQYTGGEPTVHPNFIQALAEARKRDFAQVQVATNGLRFASNEEFAARASEAGLNTVYLQFDGLDDRIYRKNRGRDLVEVKIQAIDNLYKADIRTILVPTIVKGTNDDQIGEILKFALDNIDKVAGISWQPVAFTGRIDYEQRLEQRFTLADLAREIESQTGLVDMYRDWYPFGFIDPFNKLIEAISGEMQITMSCSPMCGVATYLIVNTQTGRALPVPAFVDVDPLMEKIATITEQLKHQRFFRKISIMQKLKELRGYYHAERGPAGWKFDTFVDFMMDFADFRKRFPSNSSRQKTIGNTPYRALLLASMHFQDVYNYQLDRVRNCVVHYVAPDGRIYPFCTYNCGPCHRNRVEQTFAVPLKNTADVS